MAWWSVMSLNYVVKVDDVSGQKLIRICWLPLNWDFGFDSNPAESASVLKMKGRLVASEVRKQMGA
jgi:hypothetical protein